MKLGRKAPYPNRTSNVDRKEIPLCGIILKDPFTSFRISSATEVSAGGAT